jgi:two-component system sensor histidine kinase/response regulator
LARIREVQIPGEPDLVIEMIESFLAATPGHLAQMTEAVTRGDADKLGAAAHSVKSGAAYLGAHALQHLCLELETCARSGEIASSAGLIASLWTVWARTVIALTAELVHEKPLAV